MNVLQVYRSLSAEQKRILKEKQLSLNRPVDDVLALLKPIANCDKVADKARTPLGCTFAAGIGLLIGALIVFSNSGWGIVGALVMLIILALLVGAGTLFFWSRGVDLSNNLRQFILPVLTVLREDIEPGVPVRLEADLRSPTAPEKKTGESTPFKQGAYHKVIDSTYLDPWMTFEATLSDGTRLWWRITDSIRERKKTKRNARGKYKTKTKYAKKTDIEIELGLRRKTYDLNAAQAGEVVEKDKRNVVRLVRRERSASLDPIVPRAIIDPVADVYRRTRRVRKEA